VGDSPLRVKGKAGPWCCGGFLPAGGCDDAELRDRSAAGEGSDRAEALQHSAVQFNSTFSVGSAPQRFLFLGQQDPIILFLILTEYANGV
jgi:hypothetical protein